MTDEAHAGFPRPAEIRDALYALPEEFVLELQQQMLDALDTLVQEVAAQPGALPVQPAFRIPGYHDGRDAVPKLGDDRHEISADLIAALIAGTEPRLGMAAGTDSDRFEFVRQLLAYGTD